MARIGRRDLLALSATAALSTIGSEAFGQTTVAPHRGPQPSDVNRKFFPDGRVRPFAGNTIICPVPQQDRGYDAFNALIDISRDLPARSFNRKISPLPTSSYHMTIFSGADDQDKEKGNWPRDLRHDASMAECNDFIGKRLAEFKAETDLPIRMVVDPAAKPELIYIRLVPETAKENEKLRRLRDRLSDHLQIRTADHDTYRFHISVAYQIDWLSDAEIADFEAAFSQWHRDLSAKAHVFEFGAPEYSTFEDMYSYRKVFSLS